MANHLAYWASSSVTKEKSFITLTPGVNLIKRFIRHFHFSQILQPTQVEPLTVPTSGIPENNKQTLKTIVASKYL
jgi:hypothetical protein